ncbi:Holliday junction branch migration protein RuvA [Alkalilacustris brevis]|uniref:Holliday junction branch migration protein RuvA n=1 Tax=Alkalilacustris brevis TaxID=2026338 RepID=UPI000E0DD9A0|nr:Holliday junction branch migration protein RuvA [Alkalilacustris brevis]
MIGRIAGRLDHLGADHVLIDVQGVGYVVHVSDRTLAQMPAPGGAVALYTDLVVREDLLQLFGFPTMAEKECHRMLTTVQGVGAKASMAILGTLGAAGAVQALNLGDWAALKAAPGVGPKLAQRITNELKDKAPMLMAMASAGATAQAGDASAPPSTAPAGADAAALVETVPQPTARAASAEALSALVNLGYGQSEAAGAVAQAAREADEADTSGLIRAALKLLAPKG